jgi:tetratricopeptide (TPR) repeat protein
MTKTSEEILTLVDRLYDGREQIEGVRRSLGLLSEASDDYGALWRLSRAHFFLGQEARDKDEASAHHLEGRRAGERAVRAFDGRVEGHFWLGVNLALLAQLEKPLRAIRHALRARRTLKSAALLDSSYHGAGPLRVLARLESKLPFILGGGRRRALAHFEEALRLAPSNTVTRIYLAELLLECGEAARAHSELETLLSLPLDPAWAFETRRDQSRAQELMKKIDSMMK